MTWGKVWLAGAVVQVAVVLVWMPELSAQTTCAGCSGKILPVGGQYTEPGETTFRLGFQLLSGDQAYHLSEKVDNPPPSSDITFDREVLLLEGFHQFSRTFGAGMTLPYYEQDVHNRATGTDTHDSGWGDLSIYGLWSPWMPPEPPPVGTLLSPANFTFYAGLSLPTGDPLDGELPGLHNYHLGSGSVEFKLGVRYWTDVSESLRLFGSLVAVIDGGPDPSGFMYGNSLDCQLGGSFSPLKDLWIYGAGILISREKDHLSTIELPDSGGTWAFLEIGAGVKIVDGLSVEASVSIPVFYRVNGTQVVSDEVYSGGLRYRF